MIGAWADLATTDFAAADPARAVAILPVAATEQHGPHLPLGTDAAINRGVLAAALARLDPARWVAVLPAQEVGESLEHAGFAGTLSLSAETVLALWGEIGAAVARAGIRKLILFNSHGGQTGLVDTAAVRLRQHCGLVTVRASTFGLGLPDGLVDPAEAEHGLHGGLVETSVMLALSPHLVRRDAAADFRSTAVELAEACETLRAECAIGLGWAAQDLNLAGVTGDAAAATAELGQRILAHWAGRLAALIEDVIALPLSVLQAGPLGGTAAMTDVEIRTSDPLAAVWPHLLALRRHVRQGMTAPDGFVLESGAWRFVGEAEAADRALIDALAMVAGALGRLAIGQLGQSLDGRIATPTGKSHYINGADGRRHLHRLRALADAVIVGTGTVTADNPRLTVRLVSGPNPVRVVVDPQMRSPAERAIFAGDGPETWVLTRAAHLLGERRAQPLDLPDTPAEILDLLAARGCRVVLVEGGTATLSRFLEAGALDRLHLMIAPLLIGSGHPGFDLPPIDTLEQAHRPAVHWLPLGPELLADVQLSGDDRHVD